MTPKTKTPRSSPGLATFLTTLGAAAVMASAAPQLKDDQTTRHLWDTAYINQGARRLSSRQLSAKRRYRVATPNVPFNRVAADTVIGVTVWRLRPARRADTGERIVVHEGSEAVDWLPERVSADAQFREGDKVRFSIEVARTGYLYVIDREQYADGTLGDPFLIFPTRRTRGGDNRVKSGRIVEIPAQDDKPPFFTLKRTRSDHTGEGLIVLVTPAPLEGLQIGETAQKLLGEQVAGWEREWGTHVGRLELENSSGKPWTKGEREAGADRVRSLDDEEPAPQTLYYRYGATSFDPVLVRVQLRYPKATPGAGRSRRGISSAVH